MPSGPRHRHIPTYAASWRVSGGGKAQARAAGQRVGSRLLHWAGPWGLAAARAHGLHAPLRRCLLPSLGWGLHRRPPPAGVLAAAPRCWLCACWLCVPAQAFRSACRSIPTACLAGAATPRFPRRAVVASRQPRRGAERHPAGLAVLRKPGGRAGSARSQRGGGLPRPGGGGAGGGGGGGGGGAPARGGGGGGGGHQEGWHIPAAERRTGCRDVAWDRNHQGRHSTAGWLLAQAAHAAVASLWPRPACTCACSRAVLMADAFPGRAAAASTAPLLPWA